MSSISITFSKGERWSFSGRGERGAASLGVVKCVTAPSIKEGAAAVKAEVMAGAAAAKSRGRGLVAIMPHFGQTKVRCPFLGLEIVTSCPHLQKIFFFLATTTTTTTTVYKLCMSTYV